MKLSLAACALFQIISGSLYANWTKLDSAEFSVEPPPARGTKAYKNDFKALHTLESQRKKAECKEAQSMAVPTLETLFGPETGNLSLDEIGHVNPLMEKVFNVGERIAGDFKAHFKRVRPYNTDTTLRPCVQKPTGAKSYPSSHAALGTLGACVLGHLFPSKSVSLEKAGKRVGELRVIAGVHHPSDVEAGQKLGIAICTSLMTDKTFNDDLTDTASSL